MRQNILIKMLVTLAVVGCGTWTIAQDEDAAKNIEPKQPQQSIAELSQEAAKNFAPLTDAELAEAKSRLKESVAKLNTYLDENGENGVGWKKYFGWPELQEQLADDATPSLKTLTKIRGKFVADEEGLDWPIYADVGDDLIRYADIVRYSAAEDQKVVFDAQLKALADDLDKYKAQPTELGAFAIGARLGYLDATGQADKLVRAIRKDLSKTNLFVQTSAAFVDASMSKDVDQTHPLTDFILGTSISGTTRMIGRLSAGLADSKDSAVIQTKMIGTVHSDTVGHKGPATIWTKGTTSVDATMPLRFTGDRLTPEAPSATCSTSTEFQGLCTRPKFLQNAAWRRAYQSKGSAEYVAARHAETRVENRMAAQGEEAADEANRKLDAKFRLPLLRLRAYPETMAVSSTTDHLTIAAIQADGSQIAAPTEAPNLEDGSDLAVRVHETMLNNLTARVLAGNTYTDEELKETLKNLTGKVPEELQDNEDKDPWSITFTKVRPMICGFDDEHFTLVIQGSKYTSGEKEYKSMNISVKYKMEKTDKGSKLTRVGEIQFAPPGHKPGKTLSAGQIALRTILQKKLKNVFKPVIESDGLEFSGRLKKVGKLRLSQLASDDGWMTLAWKLPAKPADESSTASAEAANTKAIAAK
ncbi:MAG: hypothetical protein MI757_02740 [Pirellulales bacterium]|nr:hypothetical protein [Pirellulales bacterium]